MVSPHRLDSYNIKRTWCGGPGLPRASDNNIVLGTRLLKWGGRESYAEQRIDAELMGVQVNGGPDPLSFAGNFGAHCGM